MKSSCCTSAALVVTALVAGCASPGAAPTGNQTTPWPGQPGTNAYMLRAPDQTSPQQRLTVGTSYPDTELILPWFLNDIINFVNYR